MSALLVVAPVGASAAMACLTLSGDQRRVPVTVPASASARETELGSVDLTSTHTDPMRIFRPASGLPLVSHQRFPADGLLGKDELTVTPPPPMRFFMTRRLATPARLPIAAAVLLRMRS